MRRTNICPRCELPFDTYPLTSKRDSKFKICPTCANEEKMFDRSKKERTTLEIIQERAWLKKAGKY